MPRPGAWSGTGFVGIRINEWTTSRYSSRLVPK